LIGHWRESAQSKLEALAAAGCRIAMGLEDAVTMAKALKLQCGRAVAPEDYP
jgi:hypothetical protein